MTDCAGKDSWPELVGRTGEDAVVIIERENPRVNAVVILDGTPTTGDFRCDRVRVWVNSRKRSWPEVVGRRGEDAVVIIERENPRVDAFVVPVGSPGTTDFRCDRVRVPVNSHGIVVELLELAKLHARL
ncbi:hypothetical protein OSB04_023061 [Centaurea solstitialis]|uniref:Uncharacterized protein n=1 Tax=Centaurea solstitialis TaxID=347529 RepID=A0AA38SK41_9ASTR|nr:hypothetical protein OSB04_023061 [Centaurea solstitialis]